MSCSPWSPTIFLVLTHHHLGLTQFQPSLNVLASQCPYNMRSWENVNMLVPHIAALFKLLIAKANIPRSGKEVKLTPIHKKGPVTQTGSYRMIVIIGTLYRLNANLLRSMIQDWCIQYNKIPDKQRFLLFLSEQKHLTTPIHSTTPKACCTANAKRVIVVVCCFC